MAKRKVKTTTGAKSGSSANKGNKKVLWIAGAVALGVGGFFLWKWWKKKKDEKSNQGDGSLGLFTQDEATSLPSVSGSGSGIGSSYSSLATNPFGTSAELKKFQQWVIDVKKDTSILGSAGADGIWGRKSASAWEKYGAEYRKASSSTYSSSSSSGLDSDVWYWLTQNKDKFKVWGSKATESYIKNSQYPTFFNAWKEAVKRRNIDGGNTMFIWGGSYYDSYSGTLRIKGSINGKAVVAGDNTYQYGSPNQSSKGLKMTNNIGLGNVEYPVYRDNTTWVKIANTSVPVYYKYSYVKII